MSFWSGAKLLDELPRLITPFDSKQIDCAAYTLRVGAEVYISPSNRKEALGRTKRFLDHGQGFVVPPGQFAFLLTEEIVAGTRRLTCVHFDEGQNKVQGACQRVWISRRSRI